MAVRMRICFAAGFGMGQKGGALLAPGRGGHSGIASRRGISKEMPTERHIA